MRIGPSGVQVLKEKFDDIFAATKYTKVRRVKHLLVPDSSLARQRCTSHSSVTGQCARSGIPWPSRLTAAARPPGRCPPIVATGAGGAAQAEDREGADAPRAQAAARDAATGEPRPALGRLQHCKSCATYAGPCRRASLVRGYAPEQPRPAAADARDAALRPSSRDGRSATQLGASSRSARRRRGACGRRRGSSNRWVPASRCAREGPPGRWSLVVVTAGRHCW
jgi:hypothetical protein